MLHRDTAQRRFHTDLQRPYLCAFGVFPLSSIHASSFLYGVPGKKGTKYAVFVKSIAFSSLFLYNLATMTTQKAVTKDFAVIETGGKQYIVSAGDVLDVELIGDLEEGAAVEFDKVLLKDDGTKATVGTPYIAGATVKATYQGLKKGVKLSILRFKAKSNRDRKIGHRQHYARVKIDSI